MKREQLFKRILSLVLVLSMLCAYAVPVNATGDSNKVSFEKVDNSEVTGSLLTEADDLVSDEPDYADTDMVRVSIVLEKESTIAAGFYVEDIASNSEAINYRAELQKEQDIVTDSIEKTTGEKLDVAWNLTLAANIISANVPYGQIEQIEKVDGVAQVLIETCYEPDVTETSEAADPNMATSSAQIGSAAAWAAGYTGAGSRVAIIDTGVDTDHQSFSAAGFEYSLAYLAGKSGMTLDEYKASLDLLDAEEIASVADQLNVTIDADAAYVNSKIAFGYNYVDGNYNITHTGDSQGEHGSHVTGIAAANAYIQKADGTFANALNTVKTQGVAPDAQVITMKVFGASGGAYDSDYMAAIEDAIILGADSINLSLGSGNPGMSRNSTAAYQEILDSLTKAGAVVCMSAGNSGNWVENAYNVGYLYSDDVSLQTNGSPGSYTNSLAVASVDNDGFTGAYVSVGDVIVVYNETDYKNEPMTSIAGEYEYVFIDGYGTADEWAVADLTGKIAICSRGSISFYEKGDNAAAAGAAATIIYNNTSGVINMDLSDYSHTQPCVSITQADGATIKAASTPVTDDDGDVLYYTGKMTIADGVGSAQYNSAYYTMSSFSSWGVPGSLELKPEITAPGGSIYSVYGTTPSGGGSDQYEVMSGTSMASPQVAGMVAVLAQYIRENGLDVKTGKSARQLAQSLLMSTAEPMVDANSGTYYPVIQQGSGLANVGNAVTADSYIMMDANATGSYADGKVKAELGDDPERTGVYEFSFYINNLTDDDLEYDMYADLFTQDLFLYYANGNYSMSQLAYYMDTWAADMAANTTFSVDGNVLAPSTDVSGADVNKDGAVDSADVQAILDYATGTVTTLANPYAADIDGDGDIDSYDAYLLETGQKRSVTVLGNGSVKVDVKIELTADQKALLDYYYESGAYVEGYVFVESPASEEGVAGTTHSIPVLGFYGNWSDASMYEVGTYTEYATGDEYRLPYLGKTTANTWVIQYAGDSNLYYFGGNPMVTDDTYMPERNAINSENGDKISKVQFTAIRNAAASRYTATNTTTGELLAEAFPGAVSSAYYYVNGSTWRNTGYTLTTSFSPKGASEGDVLELALTLAPEYYYAGTNAAGKAIANWDELGDGATYAITMTVDNTAPELKDISLSLTSNVMTITASDNQYISAVVLYNGSGSKVLNYCGADQDANAGDTSVFQMSLDGINGNKFLLQVTDYALNTTTYKIEMQIGEPVDYTGKILGFTEGTTWHGNGNRWVEIDPENLFFYYKSGAYDYDGIETFCTTDLTVVTAEYVDGYVYMVADDGYIYVAELDDLGTCQKVCNYGDLNIVGMAMNYADGKMYIMTQADGDSSNYKMSICTMDLITGEINELYDVAVINPWAQSKTRTRLHGLAIDDAGNFYTVNYGTGTQSFLYTWTNDMAVDGKIADLYPINNSKTGTTGFYGNYASLAWDHDQDVLYMAAICSQSSSASNFLVTMDITTGKGTKVTDYDGGYGSATYASQLRLGLTGLIIVPSSNQNVGSSTAPTSIVIDKTELDLLVGATTTLNVEVYPWLLEDKSVTWTTSDESVVTVNGSGTITSVGAGTATVTATTNATPSLSASCAVTVSSLEDVKLSGLIYDVDSTTYWSDFVSDELPNWTKISGEAGSYLAGGLVDDMIYVHDGSTMFGVDADTFEVTSFGGIASSWIWSDAAPSPAMAANKVLGLCYNGTFLEMINPAEGTLSYFNLGSYFSDDPMAVIAHIEDGTYMDLYPCAYYYMMTESGVLWKLVAYTTTDGESWSLGRQKIGETGLDLSGVSAVTGGQYASMAYDAGTGYLVVTSYMEGDTAEMWAVNPDVLIPAKIGEFGESVWPVVSLYQYERATDLVVKLSPDTTSMYVGETAQIDSKIKFGTTNELTWSSSDETVATVDANGVVSGIGAGSATITATTVDKNKNGESVSASVTVNVQGLTSVDTKVNAQITTADGAKWVTIATDSMTATVNGNATTAFSGAGANGGMIYGTNSNFADACNIYQVDPSKNFAESQGSGCSTSYAILDMTSAPAVTFDATDADGNTIQVEAFGTPLYVANSQALVFLLDYVGGSLTGWSSLYYYYSDLAAITYVGSATNDSGITAHQYLLLGADGTLYKFIITPSYTASTGAVGYTLSRSVYGDIGKEFDDYQALSMAYDGTGLIIADSSKGCADLFYVDLTADTLSCGKIGRLADATGISGLYTDNQIITSTIGGSVAAEAVEDAVSVNASDVVVVETENNDDTVCSAPVSITAAYSESVSTNSGATGGLNAVVTTGNETVRPMSVSETAADEKSVTVSITAKDATGSDVDSTNGVATVTYDPAALTLTKVVVNGDVTSYVESDGSVTFGYVDKDGAAAGDTVAQLVFEVKSTDTESVTVTHKEVNDTASGYVETVAIAYGHTNTELRNQKDATCTEDGYTGDTYCVDCGKLIAKGEVIPAAGHSWSDWTTTKAATCTEDGEKVRSCACGETETEVIPATGHSYTKTTVAPTCTEDGYDEYTCDCGYSYRDNFVDAKGHSYTAVVTAPTCTEQGYTTYTCDCGDSYVADYVDATGHDWSDWAITREATCIEDGEKTRSCACGETETEVIPATGHNYTKVTVAPTCTEEGYDEYTCDCGYTYRDNFVAATGHSWSEWTTIKPATCEADGKQMRYCACGETETRTIPATGHSYEAVVTAPTCTEQGYTTYTCACGDSYVADYVDATGHSWSEWDVKDATCTEDGVKTRTCHCGEAETEVIPATGHDWSSWVITVEPDCMHEGEQTRACGHCGATETEVLPITYANCPSKHFVDVNPNSYMHASIDFVVANGYMNGTSETTFEPLSNLTRAQLITVLYRIAGTPEVEGTTGFSDVSENAYYEKAVAWAVANGIAKGHVDGTFKPNEPVSRQDLAVFFFRFAQYQEYDVSGRNDLSSFADCDSISGYALEAMQWAVSAGLINGVSDTSLAPKTSATRGTIAVISHRYCTTLGN